MEAERRAPRGSAPFHGNSAANVISVLQERSEAKPWIHTSLPWQHRRSLHGISQRLNAVQIIWPEKSGSVVVFWCLACAESVSAAAVKRVPDLLLKPLSRAVGSYLPLSSCFPADSCWWQGWSDVSWLWIALRQRTLIKLLSSFNLFLSSHPPVRLLPSHLFCP